MGEVPCSPLLSSMVFAPVICWAACEKQEDMEGLSPWEAKGPLVGPGQSRGIDGHCRSGFSDPQARGQCVTGSPWSSPQQEATEMKELPGSAGGPIHQCPVSYPSLLAGPQLAAWAWQ